MEITKRNRLHWKVIIIILTVSLTGLFSCYLIEHLFFTDTKSFSHIHIGQLTFGLFWTIGLLVLIPIQILYFDRKARHNSLPEKMTLKDTVGLPFGAFNPNAELPKWIALPIKLFAWLIIGFFLLFILVVLIGIAGSYLFGNPT